MEANDKSVSVGSGCCSQRETLWGGRNFVSRPSRTHGFSLNPFMIEAERNYRGQNVNKIASSSETAEKHDTHNCWHQILVRLADFCTESITVEGEILVAFYCDTAQNVCHVLLLCASAHSWPELWRGKTATIHYSITPISFWLFGLIAKTEA